METVGGIHVGQNCNLNFIFMWLLVNLQSIHTVCAFHENVAPKGTVRWELKKSNRYPCITIIKTEAAGKYRLCVAQI